MSSFEINPIPPFRLVPTVRGLQRSPSNRVDVLQDGRYYRVLPTAAGLRLVVVAEAGTVERPLLHASVSGDPLRRSEVEALRATLSEMLGVAVDLAEFYRLASEDSHLRPVITALRGLKPSRFPTLFESIVNSVTFQQISLPAAVAIVGRLVERYGQSLAVDDRRYYAFPEPAAVIAADRADLIALGFGGRKADVLRHLAGLVLSGDLSFDQLRPLPSAEAIDLLAKLPGIGRWTAQVILLRGLGRLDVFPIGDVGARRGVARLLGREEPLTAAEEQAVATRFGDVRGCLYFYSLGWRLFHQGLIAPAP